MRARPAAPDVFLVVMGSPYDTDLFATTLRLGKAVAEAGGTAGVWACGWSSLLTRASLAPRLPRNLADWDGDYPTTAAVIAAAVTSTPGLTWTVCESCAEQRGGLPAGDAVGVGRLGQFRHLLAHSGTVMFMGVM